MQCDRELEEYRLYARELLRHPGFTAAMVPTRWLTIRQLVAMTPLHSQRVLEIGPGSGRLLKGLLASDRIAVHGQLGAIELNPHFHDFVRRTIHDPRLALIHGRAEDFDAHCNAIFGKGGKIDRVYASTPFSLMKETRAQIFTAIRDRLTDDGEFIVYIFRDISNILREFFPVVEIIPTCRQFFPPLPCIIHRASSRKAA